jgi:putative DNA primase/helicase
MAAIGRLPETLADRCIVIRMQRKTAVEDCERLRLLDALPLRRKCARFVLDHGAAIASARPELPDTLNDRAGDIWEPLLAVADLAGGAWPEKGRQAAMALAANAQESSPIGALLLDILVCFVLFKSERIFSRDLVANLNAFQNRPWAEIRNGKPITDLWLSQQLRPYGIRPRTIWIGENQAKGYKQEDFKEVFRRYIPASEVEELMAANGSTTNRHE